MSNMFEERERAFEAKWAHDEEMQFRILVKRNELLGRWAGAELGLTGGELEQYVASIIAMSLKSSDTAALYTKLRADLGAAHSDAVILARMDDFVQAASLDAGLVQGRALDEGAVPSHQPSGHADFSHILPGGGTPSFDSGGTAHAQVGRGAAVHALHRARREKNSG